MASYPERVEFAGAQHPHAMIGRVSYKFSHIYFYEGSDEKTHCKTSCVMVVNGLSYDKDDWAYDPDLDCVVFSNGNCEIKLSDKIFFIQNAFFDVQFERDETIRLKEFFDAHK